MGRADHSAAVAAEIAALSRIGAERSVDGKRIAGAFGYVAPEFPIAVERDWLFEIRVDSAGVLRLDVDLYTAAGMQGGGEFDVDAWEQNMLSLCAEPASRATFYSLSRVARALLGRRKVRLPSGEVLSVVQP